MFPTPAVCMHGQHRSPWLGRVALALLGLVPSFLGEAAWASADGRAKLAVHVTPLVAKNQCTPQGVMDCNDLATQGVWSGVEGTQYRVYIIGEPDSTGHPFGGRIVIDYDRGDPLGSSNLRGIDIDGGGCCSVCLSGAIPTRPPEPMSYLIFGCDDPSPFRIFFYYDITVYSPDTLRVSPGIENFETTFHDCITEENRIFPATDLGYAVFTAGGSPGCNPCLAPCGAVPVRQETWGSIKALFR